ncbi:5,10-methylenetetrahydrofolate reductase [Serinibacter arcticus]|uniref:Methylenetetrahydrofolate reductase n=1 Tax=Serinibacter arcticus TaxID=1655435 RepID=A0A2U1ZWY9_9MICO|nr:methylenetetrahydrofolate reductase [Serinibacter arcticus]PWD51432.1 5,10-methylenetetrahydrofolate reductase [Serinibacter arcticus]
MTTSDLYRPPRPTISYELYPPRTPKGETQVWDTVTQLADHVADYFSVTYGASGSTASTSQALVERIINETSVPVIAHLTCVGRTAEQLREVVGAFLDAGVRNFLALRGDPPEGVVDWKPAPGEVGRACDLVTLIREVEAERFGSRGLDPISRLADHRSRRTAVSIAVAAYPGLERAGAAPDGGHPAGGVTDGAVAGASRFRVREDELVALRAKQDAGADFAITQLFFDAAAYRELLGASRAAGIRLPLVPGILPLTDPARIRRLCDLNGIAHPAEILGTLDATTDPEERRRIGLEATTSLVRDVLAAGAPGLHLYTFNKADGVTALLEDVLAERMPA